MSVSDAISGQYQIFPGGNPSVLGSRPVLAGGKLGFWLHGLNADKAGRTLGNIFTLCSHAHRNMAALVFAAANTPPDALTQNVIPQEILCYETARDHLRSIALEWPQRLLGNPDRTPDLLWLSDCPISLAGESIGDEHEQSSAALRSLLNLRAWLEKDILGKNIHVWLDAYRDPEALFSWCQAKALDLLPARYLVEQYARAKSIQIPMQPLDLLDSDPSTQVIKLNQFVTSFCADREFSQHPSWHGLCAETGPWDRLYQRHPLVTGNLDLWSRLSSRWIELIKIAAANYEDAKAHPVPLLANGALNLGKGQAIEWCEMARGLLFHWVQLDDKQLVADYRIIAPTEWNFHPSGALAKALSSLSSDDSEAAHLMVNAYDPCVNFTVKLSSQEVGDHA